MTYDEAALALQTGGIVAAPTDTVYGILGSALFPETIERLYAIRGRDLEKPLLLLIADRNDVERFGVELPSWERAFLERVWPGPVSVILPILHDECEKWRYLHRGTNTIAFRVPKKEVLRALLRKTGPLAAPSANPQGLPPATTIDEAGAYFGKSVDAYIDGGRLERKASKLIRLIDGRVEIIRE
jgi:L-threonylcarbamoyladenylate synthase